MIRQQTLAALLAAMLGAVVNVALADDVCSAAEYQTSNAKMARAKAAESQGNMEEALRLAKGTDLCVNDEDGLRSLIISASYKLGQAAEAGDNLEAAFGYYQGGMQAEQYEDLKPVDLLANAKRVMLEMVAKSPSDRQTARAALEFMNRENQSA
ncbi:MAG: hypothetical protein KA135_07930, partial [Halioglobus sp.]|nr:hypothetical protein [Halioglobus sp.]